MRSHTVSGVQRSLPLVGVRCGGRLGLHSVGIDVSEQLEGGAHRARRSVMVIEGYRVLVQAGVEVVTRLQLTLVIELAPIVPSSCEYGYCGTDDPGDDDAHDGRHGRGPIGSRTSDGDVRVAWE